MTIPSRPRLLLALEFLLYAVLTALMLHATWLTWPDAYIDFSRELYLPWRVACGDVLYRDLAYYFGPVSVYTNAALFALLGRPSIHALFALNFVFWLATLLALRALLRRIATPLAATLAVSSFILLFSFNRYISFGNFNYLAPYSHELPRGLLLALLALLALDSALRRHSAPLALLAGFFLGLTLSTKPEIALASVSSALVLFLFSSIPFSHFPWGGARPARGETPPPFPLPSLVTCHSSLCLAATVGLLAALALVLVPLSFALGSFVQALRHGLLKLYIDCFNPTLTSLPFFKKIMGTANFPLHLAWLLLGTALVVLPFLPMRFLLPRISSPPLRRAATVLLVLLAAAVGLFGFNPLNSILILAPVAFGLVALRQGYSPPLTLAFAVFAFLLASKMLLNASVTFYGFVLALPAFCCAVLLALRPPCPAIRATLAFALLLGFSSAAIRLQAATLRQWDIRHPVHDNAFRADPVNANAFNAALEWIRDNTKPGSTLAVLPEGAILNVLSDRPNPTPYVSMEEQAWPRYDEAALLAAYSNSPPDTLVLVRKPQDAAFGTDYGRSLMALLDPLYTPAFTVSIPTSSGPVPYIVIATRSSSPP